MTNQELLSDLARVKVLFQKRTLETILRDAPPKSKPDQEKEPGQ